MTNTQLIQDIARYLPRDVFGRFGPQGILSAMNRHYKSINAELKCLEKERTFSENAEGQQLPADWIEPFGIDEDNAGNQYVNPEVFDPEKDGFWTIRANYIHWGSPDATNSWDFYYYSNGLELVETVSDANNETASPEWRDESTHNILFYSIVNELWPANPNFRQFQRDYMRIRETLAQKNYNRQSVSPSRTQPHDTAPNNIYIDDYEKPGTIIRGDL